MNQQILNIIHTKQIIFAQDLNQSTERTGGNDVL